MKILNQKITYGTDMIEYSIVKTSRRKTSEVIVDKDTVEIRVPIDKPDQEIRNIIKDKANWILRKQKEYRDLSPDIIKPAFGENSTLPYLGKNYPLKILTKEASNNIRFADGQFIVNLWPSKNVTAQYIEHLYEHWLMKIARTVLKNKVETYSQKLGIDAPRKIIIKKLKNRWGSLSKNGDTINLNLNLVEFRAQLFDAPQSKQPEIDINTGLLLGAHDAADNCQPECHQWIDLPGNGFANKTQQFIEGYIHGYCSNAKNAGGAGSESDTAGFDWDGGPLHIGLYPNHHRV